jgi:Cys-tRNA(Pro)/Cys-tRNA(Cys) deacylase
MGQRTIAQPESARLRPDNVIPGRQLLACRCEDAGMTPAIVLMERHNVAFDVHEYDRGDDLRDFGREAADSLGLPFEQVFKTLLVDVDSQRDPVVAVIPVSCMVSMKLIAAAAGGKRATMCDPSVAERITGYVVGGISPLGQRKLLITVLDETIELFETVYVSGGRRGLDIALAPNDLRDLLDATIAPITA